MNNAHPARQYAADIKVTFMRFIYTMVFAVSTVACSTVHDYNPSNLAQNSMDLSESTTLAYWYIPRHLRTDQNTVGEILLIRNDNSKQRKDTSVFIRRIPRGYAAELPLSEKEFPAYFTVSKDKEKDYFTGLKFRIPF